MSQTERMLNEAQALAAAGRFAEARGVMESALREAPGDHRVHCLLCYLLIKTGDGPGAVTHGQEAVRLLPGDANYLANLGKALLMGGGSRDEAEARLREALAIDPANVNARADLVQALDAQRKHLTAADEARVGLAWSPDQPLLMGSHAQAALAAGLAEHAAAVARRNIAVNPMDIGAATTAANVLLFAPDASPEELAAVHRRLGDLMDQAAGAVGAPSFPNDRNPDRMLRLGFVSPDLREHSVAYFLEPLLRRIDRSRFDVTCYQTMAKSDATTHRLMGLSERWRDASVWDAPALAKQVRGDGIDVLIDLSGHLLGHRMGAFTLRAAPVQAHWCGYLATTGMRQMDYRIVDAVTDPPGSESQCVETLVRLDGCYLCYGPPDGAPAVANRRFADGGVMFGSFNTLHKVNERVVAAWSEVLRRTTGSRLLMKTAALTDATVREHTWQRFAEHGIDRNRIELIGWTATTAEHLALYGRVDIGLDTWPYNGATTSSEALWMGVPVVTLSGRSHAGRVCESLLRCIGLGDLVAPDEPAFVELACRLAANGDRVSELRRGMRARIEASPLRDESGFAQRWSNAVRWMWREWCAGRGPARPPSPMPPPPQGRIVGPSRAEAAAAMREASVLLAGGRAAEAKVVLQRAAQRMPTDVALLDALAGVLLQVGEAAQAVYWAQQAAAANGGATDPAVLTTLGQALAASGKGEAAIALLERAISLSPGDAPARAALAGFEAARSRVGRSLAVCREGLGYAPADAELQAQYGAALLQNGYAEGAVLRLRRLARGANASGAVGTAAGGGGGGQALLCSTLNYDPGAAPEEVASAHREFGRGVSEAMRPWRMPALPALKSTDRDRKLRVGLLSPDLRAHPVAAFIEPWLRNHDREGFEIVAYHCAADDAVSRKLAPLVGAWKNATEADHAAVARRIRADGIDVLIDLAGLTMQNRLPVMALAPARVQMTAIGYPNTTGLPEIGWRITDSVADTPEADAWHTEKLLRMPGCFLCIQPPSSDELSTARARRRGDGGGVAFGCFGTLMKFNEPLLDTWAELLRRVDGSRLVLKNQALGEEMVRDRLAERLAMRGVDRDRIDVLSPTAGYTEHLASYGAVDIALDTFPYTGTTTTCEATWMGVPTVSRSGRMHASRVGLSLLSAIGLGELVAPDAQGYVEAASRLAADGGLRDRWRRELRPMMASGPLCDGAGYSRRLEAAIRSAWHAACDSR